jgi:hypothetical protein
LDSLWAILRGYWKATGKCPNSSRQPVGDKAESPSSYWLKTWQFPSFFSEVPRFCLYLLKVEETVENFKNLQRDFSYFCSFHPYHF